jgi:hypothetical protein
MIKRIVLTAICFLLLSPLPAFATAIVALVGENSIVIASDSIILIHSMETGEPVKASTCKIRCIGRNCFAIAGLSANHRIGYDAWKLAESELRRGGLPQELAERFGADVAPILPEVVTDSRKDSPAEYAKWLQGRPVLGYLFAGFGTNGEPLVASGELTINADGHTLPMRKSVREGRPGTISLVALGSNEHISEYMKRDPTWKVSAITHPTELAETMIRVEILASEDAGRNDVGEPIVMVKLLPAGNFTLESKGVCKQN